MNPSQRFDSRIAPWVLLGPFIALFAVFTAWPLLRAVTLAFEQTFGPAATRYVGLLNFQKVLADPLFWTAMRNTTIYTAGSLFIQLPLALGLAMLLNRDGLRGRGVLRAIFFAPALVGVVCVAMMFGVIFEKRTGLANQFLHRSIGWDLDFPWLQTYVMPALIIASLWQFVGFNMVYFLAALQNVPKDLIEAATIDGAGATGRFRHVTIPSIRPVASFVVLLSLIGSFQLFELPWVMLNTTAGPNNEGLTVVMYLYQTGFQTGDLGYASAIAWLLAAVLVLITVFMRLAGGKEETR